MAAPKLPKTIGVTVNNGNDGEFVIVRNFTRGGQITGTLKSGKAALTAAPALQWENGDIVQGEIRGRLKGVKQTKIQAGGVSISIHAAADITTPGVSL